MRATFANRPFWLCEYDPTAKMTDANGNVLPWVRPTLWQFTGDGIGSKPLPGILTKGTDINSFDGTRDELEAVWKNAAAVA